MRPEVDVPRLDLLDGLRGIAAVVVVLLHAATTWGLESLLVPHALLAVDFFFLLSGYVLGMAYEQRLREGLGFAAFMRRRLIRLYPSIALGIALGVIVLGLRFVWSGAPQDWAPMLRSAATNALMLPSPAFQGPHGEAWPANPPQWSLLMELIASAAFALLLWRLRTGWLALATATAVPATVWLLVDHGAIGGGEGWATWHQGFCRVAFPFLAGLLLWRLHPPRPIAGARRKPEDRTTLLLSAGFLVLLVLPVPTAARALYEGSLVLVVFPALLWSAVRCRPSDALARRLRWLGELSFPLYAIHFPIVRAISGSVRRLLPADQLGVQAAACAGVMLVSVLLAVVVLHAYDRPVRRWLTRRWAGPDRRLSAASGPSERPVTPAG